MGTHGERAPDMQAIRRELATLRSRLEQAGLTRESEEAAFESMRRDLEALQADLQWKAEHVWASVRPDADVGLS
jgi:hypothetical protein